jgi:RNA polymerase sigma factor (sigma-70 family)
MTDSELLRQYATERSEAAFATLVDRHLPLVYSAAVRRLNGDTHRASDVAQAVFASLARDASRLAGHPVLTGWLYTATRTTSIDLARAEKRRRAREQQAHAMNVIASSSDSAADWNQLRPIIDDALDQLPPRDREAVLLRFFQSRPLAEVGRALGLSEEAARKRVDRTLDQLRNQLSRRGLTSTSAALALILANETAVATPAALASTIVSSAASAGVAAGGSIVFMTVSKLQIGIVSAIIAAGAAGLIWQQRTIARISAVSAATQQRAEALSTENAALVKAKVTAERELAQVQMSVVTAPGLNAGSVPKPANAAGGAGSNSGGSPVPTSASALDPQMVAKAHARYDPFLRERGLSPAQIDHWIELMAEKDTRQAEMQAAMREAGAHGGTQEVEALRWKVVGPLWQEMYDLLGPGGHEAFSRYERISAYQNFFDQLGPKFERIGNQLSVEQMDQITRAIHANTVLERKDPMDLGSTAHVDWQATAQQAHQFLTPAQQAVFDEFVGGLR